MSNTESLLYQLALAYNTLDSDLYASIISEDFKYSSQWVLESLTSKEQFLEYIVPKFENLNRASTRVFAELATFNNEPALILAQGESANKVCLVLVGIRKEKIATVDLCIAPHFSHATRSNVFPGIEI